MVRQRKSSLKNKKNFNIRKLRDVPVEDKFIRDWFKSYKSKKLTNKKPKINEKFPLIKLWIVAGILLLLVIISFIAPHLTGFFTGIGVSKTYTDTLNLRFRQTGEYLWTPVHKGALIQLKMSGWINGNGTARVYLVTDKGKYLVYDSSKIIKSSITGMFTGVGNTDAKEKPGKKHKEKQPEKLKGESKVHKDESKTNKNRDKQEADAEKPKAQKNRESKHEKKEAQSADKSLEKPKKTSETKEAVSASESTSSEKPESDSATEKAAINKESSGQAGGLTSENKDSNTEQSTKTARTPDARSAGQQSVEKLAKEEQHAEQPEVQPATGPTEHPPEQTTPETQQTSPTLPSEQEEQQTTTETEAPDNIKTAQPTTAATYKADETTERENDQAGEITEGKTGQASEAPEAEASKTGVLNNKTSSEKEQKINATIYEVIKERKINEGDKEDVKAVIKDLANQTDTKLINDTLDVVAELVEPYNITINKTELVKILAEHKVENKSMANNTVIKHAINATGMALNYTLNESLKILNNASLNNTKNKTFNFTQPYGTPSLIPALTNASLQNLSLQNRTFLNISQPPLPLNITVLPSKIIEKECVETCTLDYLSEDSYLIVVELDNGTELTIENLTYRIIEQANLSGLNQTNQTLYNLTNFEVLNFTHYQKIKDDPRYNVKILSAVIINDTLIVQFSHDYNRKLNVYVDGLVDYKLSKKTASKNEKITLEIFNYTNDTYFEIYVGDHTEVYSFGTPKYVNLSMQIQNEEGKPFNTSISLFSAITKELRVKAPTTTSVSVPKGRYFVEVNLSRHIRKLMLINTTLANNLSVDIKFDDNITNVSSPQGIARWSYVYAVSAFAGGQNLTITAYAAGNELYFCRDWDFTLRQCRKGWVKVRDLIPGQEYNITLPHGNFCYGEASAWMSATKDAYIRERYPYDNYGKDSFIKVGNENSHKWKRRGLIAFNLSHIPRNSRINSAELWLFKRAGAPFGNVSVYRLTHDWSEKGVSWYYGSIGHYWTNPGGDYDSSHIFATEETGHGWRIFQIRDLVQGWVNRSYDNYGLILIKSGEDIPNTGVYFISSDYPFPWFRPRLIVDYDVIEDTTPPDIELLTPPQDSAFQVNSSILISANVSDDYGVAMVTANVSANNKTYLINLEPNGTIYQGKFLNTTLPGNYSLFVKAVDMAGNINKSPLVNFGIISVPPLQTLNITLFNSSVSLNLTVNVTFNPDGSLVVYLPDESVQANYSSDGTITPAIEKIVFYGIVIHNNTLEIGVDYPADYPTAPVFDLRSVFALDLSKVDFEYAEVYVRARGIALYKCLTWDFSLRECIVNGTNWGNHTKGVKDVKEGNGTTGWIKVVDIPHDADIYNFTLYPGDPGYVEDGGAYCMSSPCIATSAMIRSVDNAGGIAEFNQPNTVDGCTDGTYGTYLTDESVENITITDLNNTFFRAGDTINIKTTVHCWGTGLSDNINIVYTNNTETTPDSWRVIDSVDPCPSGGMNVFSFNFTLDNRTGNHSIRVIIEYNGATTDTCGTGNYDDNDDVSIKVLAQNSTGNGTVPTAPVLKMEWNTTVVGSAWETINLINNYTSPVVVASVQYANNTIPVVPRITNVTSTSFMLRIQNPSNSSIVSEKVHYLVVEEGNWSLPDGTKIEAYKFLSTVVGENNNWVGESRTYVNTYTNPVVLASVMSYNDARWQVVNAWGSSRKSPPDSSNLVLSRNVAEDPVTTRLNETVGYVVIEEANNNSIGAWFESKLGSDTIRGEGNSPPYSYTFNRAFSSSPEVAIVALAGLDGGNGGWAQLHGANPLSSTSMQLAVDEDQTQDSERSHITEQVAYLVFEAAGSYSAMLEDNQPPSVLNDAPVNTSLYSINATVQISVSVTDENGISKVLVNITKPDNSFEIKELSYNNLTSRYECQFNHTNLRGQYLLRIIANDTFNNINDSETTLFIVVQPNMTLEKYSSPDPVQIGTTLTYRINYSVLKVKGYVPLKFSNMTFITEDTYEQDSPQLIESKANTLLIVYQSNQDGNNNIYLKRSEDKGRTWSSPIQLTNDSESDEVPNICEDNNGTLLVVYTRMISGKGDIYLVKSTDDGLTWSSPIAVTSTPSINEYEPAVAQDSSGMYYIGYTVFDWGVQDSEIYLINSTSYAGPWSSPLQLTNNTYNDYDLDILVEGNQFYFTWAPENPDYQEIWFVNTTDPLQLNLLDNNKVQVTDNDIYDYEPSLNKDSEGRIHIGWVALLNSSEVSLTNHDRTSNEIFIATSVDEGRSFSISQITLNNISDSYPSLVQSGTEGLYYITALRPNGSDMDVVFGLRDFSPLDAFNVLIKDKLPPGTTLANIYQGGVANNNILSWNFSWLYAGDKGYVSFDVIVDKTVQNGTIIKNVANVTYYDKDGRFIEVKNSSSATLAIDSLAPRVLSAYPSAGSYFNTTQTIEIAVNVSDNTFVDKVWVIITLPNGTQIELTLNNTAGNYYNVSYLIPDLPGRYNISYFANDTIGNLNDTVKSYFIAQGPLLKILGITITPDDDPFTNGTQINPVEDSIVIANISMRMTNSTALEYCTFNVTSDENPNLSYFFNGTLIKRNGYTYCEGNISLYYYDTPGNWSVNGTVFLNNSMQNNLTKFYYNILKSESLSTTTVSFSGKVGQTTNSTDAYPMIIRNTGNVNLTLSIKASAFTGVQNSSYFISQENVSYCITEYGIYNPLTSLYAPLMDLEVRSNNTVYFRGHIPFVPKQSYQGPITIKD